MIPLMPSPGKPKITVTPQSARVSMRTSDAVVLSMGAACVTRVLSICNKVRLTCG